MAKLGPYSENRIRELRRKRGWSEAKLGARCIPAMTADQIHKREMQQVAVTIEDLIGISRALQCHPADLLPLPAVDSAELDLVDRYRGMAEPTRQTLFGMIDVLDKPGAGSKKGSSLP